MITDNHCYDEAFKYIEQVHYLEKTAKFTIAHRGIPTIPSVLLSTTINEDLNINAFSQT